MAFAGPAKRLCVGHATAALLAAAIVAALTPGRRLAPRPRGPAPDDARRRRARPRAERGRGGQPIRAHGGEGGARGYDAGKKVNGRIRHLLMDSDGLLIAVRVTPASTSDHEGCKRLFAG